MYLFSETNDIGNWREFFDEGIKIAYAQNALIKDLEKKNEEKKSLIEELRGNNKRSVDRNYKLINECADLKEKNKDLVEYAKKKEKENEELKKKNEELDIRNKCLQHDHHIAELQQKRSIIEEAVKEDFNKNEELRCLIDDLQKDLESKDKDIQALTDQIEQLRNVIFNLNLKLYGKKEDDK